MKLSPVRPIVDQIPAGSGTNYQTWGKKSYTGLTSGMIVQSIVGDDGSTPVQIWIGFNKQPPVLFNIRDAYKAPAEFNTIEIYNNSATNWTVSAILYDGLYSPVANAITIDLTGITNPGVTSEASLQAVSTIGLATGSIELYVDGTSLALVGWQLRVDLTGVPASGKVVPSDWANPGNARSWFEVL